MNITRRNFLKIPLAASVAVALPVSADTNKLYFNDALTLTHNETALSLPDKELKPADVEGLNTWVSGNNTTKMSNGDIRWNDMSGNGHHMYVKV